MNHYTIVVSGKVQGVFFRASTQEEAQRLNLRGWVKNEADGSVRIEVEGKSQALRQFIQWCHRGPQLAHVTNVRAEPGAARNYTDFIVKR